MLKKTVFKIFFLFALLITISCNQTGKHTKREFVKSNFEQIKKENGYNSVVFESNIKKPISIAFVKKENSKIIYLDSAYNGKEKFFNIEYFDTTFSINSKLFEYKTIELISSGSFEGEKGFDYYFYISDKE